ncbi:MAG: fumarylacetoacetate hydrolase family protein [Phycisphaeraceae bacterium]|nr:fumarylacetoacetate hydrolase family protein [Phycisphaeraceae bacterium]
MELIRTPHGLAIDLPERDPLPLHTIIAIGRNYADHAREMKAEASEHPTVFMKNPMAACLHNEPITIPPVCRDPATGGDQTDFEGELAVILGSATRDVAEHAALRHVLAYTCANDVSARWWQKQGSGGQFCRGKSFDTFCPLGPRLVPPRDLPDPQALTLTTRVNGEQMQHASTRDMLFPVARIISILSQGTTLLPGTVILTGTPAGVGAARTPPRWLREGDNVEVEISAIGTLRNPVTHA